ncbi:uncharacterized protein [Haliotis cracherodii]|uniref:uncharacterized protein n=1 Tax=Haliotis cracherodii TaxID=6455 RepID=UPI0039E90B25
MVPCINKQECQPPMPIDVDMDDSAEREVLQFARENLLDSEYDWQPEERCGMPPLSTNRKTSRGKKRLDMVNEMEVDADTRHTTPLVHNSSQKRKKKGATAARVRRRLEVDQVRVQTDMLLESEDEGQMVQTTSRRQIVRPRSTPRQAVGAPDGPPKVTSHLQAVKDFAATLSMTQLQTIVTELLFRDQGSFEDYLHGYRPCDNPPSQPQPEDLPRWCRCGNCRPMPSAQENKCCWQTGSSQCVVNLPNFYTVITHAILDLAMAHYNEFLVHDQDRSNAVYRHQAYRQFVLQRFGRLGMGNRRVVPSCVVLAIRLRFPDPRVIYSGFKAM